MNPELVFINLKCTCFLFPRINEKISISNLAACIVLNNCHVICSKHTLFHMQISVRCWDSSPSCFWETASPSKEYIMLIRGLNIWKIVQRAAVVCFIYNIWLCRISELSNTLFIQWSEGWLISIWETRPWEGDEMIFVNLDFTTLTSIVKQQTDAVGVCGCLDVRCLLWIDIFVPGLKCLRTASLLTW